MPSSAGITGEVALEHARRRAAALAHLHPRRRTGRGGGVVHPLGGSGARRGVVRCLPALGSLRTLRGDLLHHRGQLGQPVHDPLVLDGEQDDRRPVALVGELVEERLALGAVEAGREAVQAAGLALGLADAADDPTASSRPTRATAHADRRPVMNWTILRMAASGLEWSCQHLDC
ncbi:hypothetical protein [Ornithinimicrobium flavum]|uniref:hypothetical protein n=1 Tax=Ornithinimicrobium flavum TaxID=1288636 RepID=UPI001EE7ACEC|nr:hypothetical protein [Ornithinimicrobium flavum]